MRLIVFGLLFLALNIFAQDNQTVVLTVSGYGTTREDARKDALRSAIEQAFGVFISSRTQILNDRLIKDEIISISSGNIQSFEIISEVLLPGENHVSTLKATVSIPKLTSFAESKGINVEFKGSLFAFNVNQQILNEKNELKAIENLCEVIEKLANASFNYSISVEQPISATASNNMWRIPIQVHVFANKNFLTLSDYFLETLRGISLSRSEAVNYFELGKQVYPISVAASNNNFDWILLRNQGSALLLLQTLFNLRYSVLNFKITNGIDEIQINEMSKYNFVSASPKDNNNRYLADNLNQSIENQIIIKDDRFRLFLRRKYNYGSNICVLYQGGSVFFDQFNFWEPAETEWASESYKDFISGYKKSKPTRYFDDFLMEIRNFRNFCYQDIFNKPEISTVEFFSGNFGFVNKLNNQNTRTSARRRGQELLSRLSETSFDNTAESSQVNNPSNHIIVKPFNPSDYFPGIVISFAGINETSEVVNLKFNDFRTLDQINRITEYRINVAF